MGVIGNLFGKAASNDSAQQLFLWGVLYGFLSSAFQPVLTGVEQEVWEVAVEAGLHRALSPDLLATMVVRGWIDQATGEAEASKEGVDAKDFDRMVANARNPIAPEEAAIALRRKIIPEDAEPGTPSYMNAIRQGNLGDQWADVIKQLATAIPSPSDILDAALEGQIPDGEDPKVLYQQVGGDPSWYELMYNTKGSAPTPLEAAQMVFRGAIPRHGEGPGVVSFDQAFLEGPWRNKWMDAYWKVAEYRPPPRTITAMLKEGSLSADYAKQLLEQNGLTPELADAYITSATSQKVQAHKDLALSTVEEMYFAQMIDQATAAGLITDLGYDSTEIGFLLALVDMRRSLAAVNSAINRIGTYYIAHKLTGNQVQTALSQLGVPASQIQSLITTWNIDASANIKLLTPTQIYNAFKYGIIDQPTAQSELEALGYTPYDAWVFMSVENKAPLPNPPAPGAGVLG